MSIRVGVLLASIQTSALIIAFPTLIKDLGSSLGCDYSDDPTPLPDQ
jgi:hypothetical protein